MKIIKNYWTFIVIILLSYFAIHPLFVSGFFPMHDDTQVARVYEMGKSLKDGMFPVRWVSDLGYGYGYPIFNFYAPLAYYIGGIFNILGFDALTATKIMMGLGILLAGIFMYFLAKEFWGKIGGVLSALFYIYAPYHAINIYVRGDVAEFWAYAFMPLVFYGLWKVYKEQKWKWVIVGGVGYAGVILSHNLTALMITPFLIIVILLYFYIAYRNIKLSITYYSLLTILFGLLSSSFYWFPALLEMRYTNVLSQVGGGADFRNHFVCLPQLWDSLWGFGGSVLGCIDGMSFKIGKLHILLTLLSVFITFILIFKKKLKHFKDRLIIIIFSLLGFIISVLLMLEISMPVWEVISPMAFFQYPWRFLLLASFFSSFLAGYLIWFFKEFKFFSSKYFPNLIYISFLSLVVLIVVFNTKFFKPQTILPKNAADYTNEKELKWRVSKISDEYLPQNFSKPKSENDIIRETFVSNKALVVNQIEAKTQIIKASVYSSKAQMIDLNIAYFPAWRIFVDDKKSAINPTKMGINFYLPQGEHRIRIQFEETIIEKTANIISITSIILLILGIIYTRKTYE